MEKQSLLLGCGNSLAKKVFLPGQDRWTGKLVTVDMDPNCGADHVFDMGMQYDGTRFYLPFEDGAFDEIGAYDSLEHWGRQGDWRGWFAECAEYHRILKPGGTFGIIVPTGEDALADPGHTRFFSPNYFYMLNQQWYADALAKGVQVTDYRWIWTLNFDIAHMQDCDGHHLAVILRKPL